MSDRHISATAGISGLLWVGGTALMIAGGFDLRFMGWGLWLTCIAATLTIRRMLCNQEHVSRNAFELGCDYGRSDASVHSLR